MPLDALGDALADTPGQAVPAIAVPPAASRLALDPRTERLLEAPIAPMLLRLAWPNIAVMLVTGLDRADRDLVGLAARSRRAWPAWRWSFPGS